MVEILDEGSEMTRLLYIVGSMIFRHRQTNLVRMLLCVYRFDCIYYEMHGETFTGVQWVRDFIPIPKPIKWLAPLIKIWRVK